MDRLIKNIMERIAEKREDYYLNDDIYDPIAVDALDFACDVIEEEVKEYNNGWIPCSERLPEKREDVLVWDSNQEIHCVAWYNSQTRIWYSNDFETADSNNIIAWQPLPSSYKKGE